MIVEVNDVGEIMIPAELGNNGGSAPPHTRLQANREGALLVLQPLTEKAAAGNRRVVDSLVVFEGQLNDPAMTFRREDIYGEDVR